MAPLKQTSGYLRVGDVIRVTDREYLGEIAVCVESDGHAEHPYACVVLSGNKQDREPIWPNRYIKLGNVVENVALWERERLRVVELADRQRVRDDRPIPKLRIPKAKKK
jgi:hypothetical protein